uniref:Uncharacterized protein n=1 Tax=viral metagenome TaxID=1070528 RepID=A0A6M3LNT7_9ZZZZ
MPFMIPKDPNTGEPAFRLQTDEELVRASKARAKLEAERLAGQFKTEEDMNRFVCGQLGIPYVPKEEREQKLKSSTVNSGFSSGY